MSYIYDLWELDARFEVILVKIRLRSCRLWCCIAIQ